MPVYRDKNGTWYVMCRYADWRGERKQKCKRGLRTKRDAQAWEREFLMQKQADVNMTFASFVQLYEWDVKPKLKLNTWLSKESVIQKKLLPYFGQRRLSEITAKDVLAWQNEMRSHTARRQALLPNLSQVYPQSVERHLQPRCSLLRSASQPRGKSWRDGREGTAGDAVLDKGGIPAFRRRHDGQAPVLLRF